MSAFEVRSRFQPHIRPNAAIDAASIRPTSRNRSKASSAESGFSMTSFSKFHPLKDLSVCASSAPAAVGLVELPAEIPLRVRMPQKRHQL